MVSGSASGGLQTFKLTTTMPSPTKKDKKIFIVLPVYNEEKIITEVLKEIQSAGYTNIITVDDGSKDNSYQTIKNFDKNITALKHRLNRGKGAATKTGIEGAKILGADIIVTMDSDGQHDPKDIESLIKPIIDKKCQVALGSRLKNRQQMPLFKKACNWAGNLVTWYLTGLWVTDSQSGFRAYSAEAVNRINTRGDRYEYESEVVHQIRKNKLSFKEIPIEVRYTDYSMGKVEKQNLLNGFKTVYKLIWNIIS
jgi:glycosyltransferase involved in cell wall biosynthesis